MAYGDKEPMKKETKKASVKKPASSKMTDAQKKQLNSHMEKHKDKMSLSEMKSHRMKMMVRMRKGMSVAKSHADIMK